jgi:hypothetical protein
MRVFSLPYLAFALALAACGEADPQPPLVLQGRSNAEHVRQVCDRARVWHQHNRDLIERVGCDAAPSCRDLMPLVTRCAADPLADLRAFEDEITAHARAAPQCRSVRLLRLDDRNEPEAATAAVLAKPHWRLHVDFQPAQPRHRWWLTDSPGRATFPKGEGDAREVAEAVCAIAVERGARMLN